MKLLQVTTQDEIVMQIPFEELKLSELIKTIMESSDELITEFPLPNVNSSMLKKIIEFCKMYKKNPMKPIPKPLPLLEFDQILDPEYSNYISSFQTIDELYELIKSVNYLDIPPIQELACAKIASFIRGKEPEEIRRILKIEES